MRCWPTSAESGAGPPRPSHGPGGSAARIVAQLEAGHGLVLAEHEWDESPLMALKKAELLETAEGLGVEVDSKMTKQQIADAVLSHIG